MDKLPAEIKLAIAESACDRTQETLKALSRVNWEWNAIAGPVLYRHLIISLRYRVARPSFLDLPQTQRVFSHVKRLSIMTVDGSESEQEAYQEVRDALEEVDLGGKWISPCPYYEGDWAPIVNLIRMLPHLYEFDMLDGKGGPVTLADTMLQYHPTCRVSLFTSTRSTGTAWDNSPLLHAVHQCFEEFGHRYRQAKERLLGNIVQQAPHVRRVALQSWVEIPMQERQPPPQPPMVALNIPPAPAQLESFCWPLTKNLTAKHFHNLSRLTDMRQLKTWMTGWIQDELLLQNIVEMHPFEKLTRLTITLRAPTKDDQVFWSRAEAMLESLPPLTYLCLLGAYTPGFLTGGGVLRKHGPTLLELCLHRSEHLWYRPQQWELVATSGMGPRFSRDDILALAHQLPRLKKLRICVQRRRGLEADAYPALGGFSCLEELDLVLNCVPEMDANEGPIPPRELTECEKGRSWLGASSIFSWPNWHLRDLLINCAIDKPLAKAIFAHVSGSQRGHGLQRLTIHPLYGQVDQYTLYGPHGYLQGTVDEDLLRQLAPTWTVELDLLTGLRTEPSFWPSVLPAVLEPDLLHSIVQSIWPTEHRKDGRLEWHSWPLRSSDVETAQDIYEEKPM
ncbi:hypothetical protein ASPBRDRAFT_200621 [Aspergillus brasiliensis CBS 101740]|uniref:Uncharacterized protein n=1 Tax=Aspergillus brasiliensis (strain CBS 101740 / IMI 381727 / IBT 21946) TaxID=767769 RepID=A0A1L9U5R4_ASPBC|nr:hypothetical protein ASPBRDRAFT_200621 [Aspergillus brasiliensis CBS 101740]